MDCKICRSKLVFAFDVMIMAKYKIGYHHCPNCKSLFTEEPYWLNEAYKDSINDTDTGILQRNLSLAKQSSLLLFYLFEHDKTFLDFAGGYGIYVRLMRDKGFNFLWNDLYTQNILAKGFEFRSEQVELITSFESFEHFINPIEEIEKMLSISPNILFSTVLLPNPVPKPEEWWYYGLDHGQHISFYSLSSLKLIADKYSLNFCSNGKNLHLFSKRKINNVLFNILLKEPLALPLQFLMKHKLKSKIHHDHLFLKTTANK